ncbi:CotH kinase family protein [Candidatus Saccharibacteria bacterium]|nr:CotH kinase family protein [Candidatus Saccharibacteria bacterium]MBR3132443.1 CotH kinase family protein [Candidatus Saccharibacteria bacterium]
MAKKKLAEKKAIRKKIVKKKVAKKKWLRWLLVGFLLLLILGIGIGFLVRWRIEKDEINAKYPDRGVPRIDISLNGISLEEINDGSKDKKYGGNELIIYDAEEAIKYQGVEIKGRGNISWEQPKRSYQMNFKTSINLFDLGKAKKWVLISNYLDNSMLRNDVAMILAEMLEEKYNSRGGFAELYFNGEYNGLYYVMKKIEISKNSLDLREDGAILFELDTLHKEECYKTIFGDCLILKDVRLSKNEEKEKMAEGFLRDFNEFEEMAEEGKYNKISKIIDTESFAKYFLVNEFTVNPDAYSSSFFLYRDGINDKIHAGPVWDFDFALGNKEWWWRVDDEFLLPNRSMARKKEVFGDDEVKKDSNISRLMYYLMEIPEFSNEVSRIFQEQMSGRKDELVSMIGNKYENIYGAAMINNEKWERKDYEKEVEYLIKWVSDRYDYFEQEYGVSKKDPEFL